MITTKIITVTHKFKYVCRGRNNCNTKQNYSSLKCSLNVYVNVFFKIFIQKCLKMHVELYARVY